MDLTVEHDSDKMASSAAPIVKHHIVALDAWVEPPAFAFDHDVTVVPNGTIPDSESLSSATIFMTSGTRVTGDMVQKASKLQLVAVNGTGVDHVDRETLKERRIALCHVPAQNTESVSEHAFALYYALRRKIIPMHEMTMAGTVWPQTKAPHLSFGQPTRTNAEETLV